METQQKGILLNIPVIHWSFFSVHSSAIRFGCIRQIEFLFVFPVAWWIFCFKYGSFRSWCLGPSTVSPILSIILDIDCKLISVENLKCKTKLYDIIKCVLVFDTEQLCCQSRERYMYFLILKRNIIIFKRAHRKTQHYMYNPIFNYWIIKSFDPSPHPVA